MDSESFNKNYKVLKETADWLTKQGEPDIDQLVPRVETAMKAYAICKERLEKVQETLGRHLGGEKVPGRAAGETTDGISNGAIPTADGGVEDDDIPF